MKCTGKEWDTCRVEKMGCNGCYYDKELKIIELFGGIGACTSALKRINVNYKIVDYVDNDKYAVASYNAINNTNFEIQDIRDWNKKVDADFIMHGSPCQDFSLAGKQAGGDIGSGTRSSLMYETIRIVGQIRPKYVLWENVKNILSKKHIHNFNKYIEALNVLGYNNYYKVLNAKDYGVPQNRERIYTVSIRKDVDKNKFEFPKEEKLILKLKDILEKEVDDKYYLSEKMKDYILDNNDSQKGTKWEGRADNDVLNANVAHALSVRGAGGSQRAGVSNFIIDDMNEEIKVKDLKLKIKNATKKGYDLAVEGDSINLQYPNSKTRRGRVGHQVSQTVMANDNMGVIENLKIRKLTPRECWRLMGFLDEEYERAEKVNSNAQLYKQAGNSIVVNVLEKNI